MPKYEMPNTSDYSTNRNEMLKNIANESAIANQLTVLNARINCVLNGKYNDKETKDNIINNIIREMNEALD